MNKKKRKFILEFVILGIKFIHLNPVYLSVNKNPL